MTDIHIADTQGEKNPAAKLTESNVRDIRRLVSGGSPQKDVAALYNVSPSCISAIVKRRKWGHVR